MTKTLTQMTARTLMASAARRFPDDTAFICAATGRRASFAEVDARSGRLAAALLGRGLRKGETVALLAPNRMEAAEAYFGIGRAGLVALPLGTRTLPAEMAAQARAAGARLIIYDARLAEGAAAVTAAGLPGLAFGAGSDGSYEAAIAAAPPWSPGASPEVEEHDPFYFNTTSGTTGKPKSYLLSHYNNAAMTPLIQAMELGRRDVVMTVFPMSGRIGFGWVWVSAMLGIPNVLADFDPAAALRLIEEHGVTAVNLVPTMAAMLLPEQARAPRRLASLRAVIFAGSPLPPTLREEVEARLCPRVYEFYGMNELGAMCASAPADRLSRPYSVGRPLVFNELRAVGPDGEDVAPGEIGELVGRSPMSATAYHGDPAATAETFAGGWLRTGDLGSIAPDGYVTLRGRKKDMIVTGGQNVYAAEVENVLAEIPGLAEHAVIGLPDPLWGERVAAVIVAGEGAPDAAALEAHCRARLPGYKVPKSFHFVEGPLPRTATAKVQKFKLPAMLAGGVHP